MPRHQKRFSCPVKNVRSRKPGRTPSHAAPLSTAARLASSHRCVRASSATLRASPILRGISNDRRKPARAEPHRSRKGVPRGWFLLRVRLYQQHGNIPDSRLRFRRGYVVENDPHRFAFLAHHVYARVLRDLLRSARNSHGRVRPPSRAPTNTASRKFSEVPTRP